MPLFATRNGEPVLIGRIEIIAAATDAGAYDQLAELTDLLSDIGPEMNHIVAELELKKQTEASKPQTETAKSEPVSAS